MSNIKVEHVFGLTRIVMGWIFLWAFMDKLFGLGFSTTPDKSWLVGTSPTQGFLEFATSGPFASLYQSIAGNIFVDWLYMLGLLGVGLALILGIGVKIAGWSGAIMMALFYSAALPPEHNPLVDEHIIYILILLAFPMAKAGYWLGFGRWWGNTILVQKFPILE